MPPKKSRTPPKSADDLITADARKPYQHEADTLPFSSWQSWSFAQVPICPILRRDTPSATEHHLKVGGMAGGCRGTGGINLAV